MVGYELWPYISNIILRAVETNYMQNNRADLNFQRRWMSFLRTHQNKRTDIKHFNILIHPFFRDTLYHFQFRRFSYMKMSYFSIVIMKKATISRFGWMVLHPLCCIWMTHRKLLLSTLDQLKHDSSTGWAICMGYLYIHTSPEHGCKSE